MQHICKYSALAASHHDNCVLNAVCDSARRTRGASLDSAHAHHYMMDSSNSIVSCEPCAMVGGVRIPYLDSNGHACACDDVHMRLRQGFVVYVAAYFGILLPSAQMLCHWAL